MNENRKQLSVRVDSSIISKIESAMKSTGLTKTEVVSRLLSNETTFIIINSEKIAAELFEMRSILERRAIDAALAEEIRSVLKELKIEIANLFTERGNHHGNIESNQL